MATSHSPSSSNEHAYQISVQPQPPVSKSGPRRLPPPCWSDAETVALIEVYRDKWYSLRRGNLRAPDWQEVADGVAARCNGNGNGYQPKTSIQCRHKMEKLRKRYRTEVQRIGNVTKAYSSSWIHFRLMDSMELGTSASDRYDDDEVDENEEDQMLYGESGKQAVVLPVNRRYQGNNGNSVRIKIPSFGGASGDDLPPSMRNGYSKNNGDGDNVMNDMVVAIEKLGDRFVKMEKMKMDMARELETMRMKEEMKQTEMILETHRKIWDLLVVEKKNKKMKTMPSSES